MKEVDRYHKWVEWSKENQVYIGKCPDLITGIHGANPIKLYEELHEVVENIIEHFISKGRELPEFRIKPM